MKIIIIMLFWLSFAMPILAGTYVDNFDDNDLGTWVIFHLAEKVEVANGEVIIIDLDGNVASTIGFNDEQKIADFVVSFDGKAVRLFGGNPYMWLLFRSTGDPSKEFSISPMVSFRLDRNDILTSIFAGMLNGFQLVGSVTTPMQLKLDTWYHIKVEVQSTKVTIWADDVLMRTVDWANQPQFPKSGSLAIGGGGGTAF